MDIVIVKGNGIGMKVEVKMEIIIGYGMKIGIRIETRMGIGFE